MSNVTLSIGGRSFTVSCAPGEEAHVARLGEMVDAKALASGAVGQSETRMLLFAALMLADALDEATPKVDTKAGALPPDLADRLGAIAVAIENLANVLEPGDANA